MGSTEIQIDVREGPRAQRWSALGAALRLQPSERKLLLAVGDVLLFNATLALGLVLRTAVTGLAPTIWQTEAWFLLLNGLWFVVALVSSTYDLVLAALPYRSAYRAGGLALIVAALCIAVPHWVWPGHQFGPLLFPLVVGAAVGMWRIVYAKVLAQSTFDVAALVIGAGEAGKTIARAVAQQADARDDSLRGTGYRLLGYIDDDPALQGQVVERVRVIGTRHDLLSLVRQLQLDSLIVAINQPDQVHPELLSDIVQCAEMGIRIIPMPALYEHLTGRVPVEHTGDNLYVALYLERGAWDRVYGLLWRFVDIGIGLLGCWAVAVVIPWIWLANRLSSPGDLFYRQARVGHGGRLFQVLKFRSMIMDAERECGAVWACQGDSRITPVGRILRKTRLDELPQFWNVLRGDMGLIGPRPERPEFVAQLAEQIPYYRVRHAVRPGITGWAQVSYGYGNSVEDAKVKLEHDLYYLRHRGPYLDLKILLRTVQVVLRMEGM
jgi:exopolysaccharide biosynthesis polyprenyl glycosylphosphotransferase